MRSSILGPRRLSSSEVAIVLYSDLTILCGASADTLLVPFVAFECAIERDRKDESALFWQRAGDEVTDCR